MEEVHPILLKPIDKVLTSDEFQEMAAYNHFETLQQIILISVYELVKLPKFGYRMLRELNIILDSYGLGNLLIED